MVIEVSSEQSRRQFICIHSAAAAAAALCCYTAVAAAATVLLLLLLFIVCRMAKVVADSLNLTPVCSFSSFKRDLYMMVRARPAKSLPEVDWPCPDQYNIFSVFF